MSLVVILLIAIILLIAPGIIIIPGIFLAYMVGFVFAKIASIFVRKKS